MAVTAYVLITSSAAATKSALEKLKASQFVQVAHAVTGPYDIIATVVAEDIDALGRVITQEIHTIDGVERTLACIVMDI